MYVMYNICAVINKFHHLYYNFPFCEFSSRFIRVTAVQSEYHSINLKLKIT